MDYEFKVLQEPTYLHVVGAGTYAHENLRRFLIDANKAAAACGSDCLLLELNFAGPSLSLASIYSVILERSPDGARFKRIAYVDANAQHAPEQAEFAAMAAFGLGVNVRLFQNLVEAKRWLKVSA
jgi:hypothetical protein